MLRVHRSTAVRVGIIAGLACSSLVVAGQEPPLHLTLRKAVQEAFARSPVIRARRAELDQALGRTRSARTFLFNPELSFEAARRRGEMDSSTDRAITLSQVFEIGGQRRRRAGIAAAEQDAVSRRLQRAERLLAAAVSAAFMEVLGQRAFLEVEQANTDLALSLADVARKRYNAGAVPRMEINLAQVQVGRAQRRLELARAAHDVALTILGEQIGLRPDLPLEVEGDLILPFRVETPLADLLETALARRADLMAFREIVRASEVRIGLARRQRVPNLVGGAFYGKEEATDRLAGGFIGARIPIFNRNRGAIMEAKGILSQAQAEQDIVELQVMQEVSSALARFKAAQTSTRSLEDLVLDSLQENLRLLQRSFESGKTSWTEVLVFRREFVEIRREYIETLMDAQLAGIELDLATGLTPVASHDEESQP